MATVTRCHGPGRNGSGPPFGQGNPSYAQGIPTHTKGNASFTFGCAANGNTVGIDATGYTGIFGGTAGNSIKPPPPSQTPFVGLLAPPPPTPASANWYKTPSKASGQKRTATSLDEASAKKLSALESQQKIATEKKRRARKQIDKRHKQVDKKHWNTTPISSQE
jgi:hypothetical protein